MAAIFRGPQHRIPEMVNLPVAGAYFAGLVVTSNDVVLTQAADATGNLLILGEEPNSGNGTTVAYTSGNTGAAFQPVPGDTYAIRAAAATYTIGQALTVNASGQVAAASSGDLVFGHAAEAGAKSAADLLDVTISTRYTEPA